MDKDDLRSAEVGLVAISQAAGVPWNEVLEELTGTIFSEEEASEITYWVTKS